MSLNFLQEVLTEFLRNSVAKFCCANIANKLGADITCEVDFSRQKQILQREILVHICREIDEQCYKDLLSEAEKWLCVEKEIGYSCMFAGCSFKNSKHKRYINHLKNIHIGKTNLLCSRTP